ncbi:hypothetical protein PF008_g31442, partial [Phytophthora fragariae]
MGAARCRCPPFRPAGAVADAPFFSFGLLLSAFFTTATTVCTACRRSSIRSGPPSPCSPSTSRFTIVRSTFALSWCCSRNSVANMPVAIANAPSARRCRRRRDVVRPPLTNSGIRCTPRGGTGTTGVAVISGLGAESAATSTDWS